MSYISIKNLNYKYYDGTIALENVNVDINKNEKIAVVGDNGAGKSTLIKVISGVYQPEAGRIFFEGVETKIETPMMPLGLVLKPFIRTWPWPKT